MTNRISKKLAATLALALAACSQDDPPTKPEKHNADSGNDPLYAIMYEVFDDVGSTSYLNVLPSLDVEEVDVSEGREYGGGRAFLQTYNGWIFVGDAATPEVTRYSVAASGSLVEKGVVSFANYGLESGSLDTWNVSFISPTKAYLFDFEEGTTIIWNPTTMKITGEIPVPKELLREGWTLEGSPGIVRGNRLFRTFDWVDNDEGTWLPEQLLGVYDLDNDELLTLVPEKRCSAFGNLVHRDEDGTFYFSSWIWPVGETLLHDGAPGCVLRILPDDEGFDQDWSLTYRELTGGREGAMFSYLREQQALFSVFYDERISADETTDSWEYAGSENWRIWSLDMKTRQAAPVEGIDFNAGAYTPISVDGRDFVMVPNSTWDLTQLYEMNNGHAEAGLKVPGWTYQFVKVR
jgi:hypothetical protein